MRKQEEVSEEKKEKHNTQLYNLVRHRRYMERSYPIVPRTSKTIIVSKTAERCEKEKEGSSATSSKK